MTSESRLITFALNSYPSWWRERYRDEVGAVVDGLVEAGRSPLWISSNLLRSSITARIRGTGAPPSREFWVHRTQQSLLVASLAWFTIVPLSIVFMLSIGENEASYGSTLVQLSRAGAIAHKLQSVAGIVILLIFVIALRGWRQLRSGLEGQAIPTKLFRVVNRGAMVGITLTIAALFLGEHNSTSMFAEVCAYIGLSLFVCAWLLTPAVISQMLRHGELSVTNLRKVVSGSAILVWLYGLITLLVVGSEVALTAQPVPASGASYLSLHSGLGGWSMLLCVGFVVLTTLSGIGASVSRRSCEQILTA
jgi:hypothetical protein